MTINELIDTAHQNAKDAGWWDEERNTGELLMLIVSECGEALEAHRSGKRADMQNFNAFMPESVSEEQAFRDYIKDTFEDELADIVIRIADLMGDIGWKDDGIGLPSHIRFGDNVGEDLLAVVRQVSMDSPMAISSGMNMVFAIAKAHKIDLWRHIELKMAYNKTRPRKHGKAY
jgi:NTP pyrophosphatase (non-canonical NTP hydrolase)